MTLLNRFTHLVALGLIASGRIGRVRKTAARIGIILWLDRRFPFGKALRLSVE